MPHSRVVMGKTQDQLLNNLTFAQTLINFL